MEIKENILQTIGRTPLVRINKTNDSLAEIYAKIESFNPGASIKDRVGLSMIEQAEKDGILKEGSIIIEPTSGNTGIGLAMVSAVKGYKLILTMPDTMSEERRNLLKAYGAELVLTPGNEGMIGSIKKAEELSKKYENSFIPQQFKNLANPEAHRRTTVKEIINDTDGNIDIFVAGVGTGGTITGIGSELKKIIKDIKIVAVEPYGSAVLSGEKSGPHQLQGIGAGFIPDILDQNVYDEIVQVKKEEAFGMTKKLAQKEGILVGISSGAAMSAAIKLGKREENRGKKIVVILPDSGERYLTTGVFG